MKRILLCLGFAVCQGVLLPQISHASCHDTLEQGLEQKSTPWIQVASQATGVVIGAASDIVMTVTTGNVQLLAPQLVKWLPLLNEMANVAGTSSGIDWIYTGIRKKIIDGIAMGGIVGQSVHAGFQYGPFAGLATFGVTVGLTYWFPNRYFRSIMQGLPERLPPRLEKIFKTPAGQGVIGVSMIVVLEQVLIHAQYLAHLLPSLWSYEMRDTLTHPDIFISRVAVVPKFSIEDGKSIHPFLIYLT